MCEYVDRVNASSLPEKTKNDLIDNYFKSKFTAIAQQNEMERMLIARRKAYELMKKMENWKW